MEKMFQITEDEANAVKALLALSLLFFLLLFVVGSRCWTTKKLKKLEGQEKYFAEKGGIVPKFFKPTNQENVEKSKKRDFSTK